MIGTMAWQPGDWPGAITSLEIDTSHLGLVLVDLQYSCVGPDPRTSSAPGERAAHTWEVVIPNSAALLSWFRAHGHAIVFTRVGSLLPDAEDQHDKRRIAWHRRPDGPPVRSPVGSPDYEIVAELAPRRDEIVIDKNSSGAFNSSNLEHVLFQLGLQTLVICGVSTSACVDNTARDAADRGFNVMLAEDACAGGSHLESLRTFSRCFGSVKPTADILAALGAIEAGRLLPNPVPA